MVPGIKIGWIMLFFMLCLSFPKIADAVFIESPNEFIIRNTTNLIAYYPLLAEDCKRPSSTPTPTPNPATVSTFADVIGGPGSVGNLVTGSANFNCLHRSLPPALYEFSRNGIKSPGADVKHILRSTGNIQNFTSQIITNQITSEARFTIEMWIRPDFGSEAPPTFQNYLVLFEIGDSVADGTYVCYDNYGIRVGIYRTPGGVHRFFGRMLGHSDQCSAQTESENIPGGLKNGHLYHVVVNVHGDKIGASRRDYMDVYINDAESPNFVSTENVNYFHIEATRSAGRAVPLPVISAWKDSWVVHVGTTPAAAIGDGSSGAWRGEISHVALYKGKMDLSQMEDLFVAKMVNTAPAVVSMDGTANNLASVSAPEDTKTTINLTSAAYDFDIDGYLTQDGFYPTDQLTYQIIDAPKQASTPKGKLFDGNTQISSYPVNITDPTQLKYLSDLDDSGSNDIRFKFRVFDSYTSSIGDGTVKIALTETNDDPVAVAPLTQSVVEGETVAIILSGKDKDLGKNTYGVRGVYILSQLNSTLGTLYEYNKTSSSCSTDEITTFPFQIQFGGNPPNANFEPASENRARFCYQASVGSGDKSKTIVGIDKITFEAYDMVDARSANVSFNIQVRNALLAGCFQPANNNPCQLSTFENAQLAKIGDVPVPGSSVFYLNGYDSIGRPSSERSYVITSLPQVGKIYLWGGTGNILGNEIEVEMAYPAESDGRFQFIYVSEPYYYNQFCKNADGESGGSCSDLSQPIKHPDLAGNGINGCISSNGCPVTFNYRLQMSDDSESPILAPGAQIWVTNVNNPVYNITAPFVIERMKQNMPYVINTLSPLLIQDHDGDARVIGVSIRIRGTKSSVRAKNIPTELIDDTRIRFIDGSNCFESGNCPGSIIFKAPISDANLFLSNLEVITTVEKGSEDLVIAVWDPVDDNGSPWDLSSDPTAEAEVRLEFGEPVPLPEADPLIQILIYIGIGMGALVVVASFAGCVTNICMRARRGERSAMWIVRNILCTHVGEEPDDDARKSIKRRLSIESAVSGAETNFRNAIKAEHSRMRKVVICANLLGCVLPCCCKRYKERMKRASMPSVREMVEVAVMLEREKIAQSYVPEDDDDAKEKEKSKGDGFAKVVKDKTAKNKSDKEKEKAAGDNDAEAKKKAADDDHDEEIEIDRVADDSIFDWEKHIDPKSGRPYYYNPKTNKSSWEPPKVKIRRKSLDNAAKQVGVTKESNNGATKRFEPKPPSKPKEAKKDKDDDDDNSSNSDKGGDGSNRNVAKG